MDPPQARNHKSHKDSKVETGLSGRNRGIWLGSRDSNPDSMIQSHVSCHWTTSQHGLPIIINLDKIFNTCGQ